MRAASFLQPTEEAEHKLVLTCVRLFAIFYLENLSDLFFVSIVEFSIKMLCFLNVFAPKIRNVVVLWSTRGYFWGRRASPSPSASGSWGVL